MELCGITKLVNFGIKTITGPKMLIMGKILGCAKVGHDNVTLVVAD